MKFIIYLSILSFLLYAVVCAENLILNIAAGMVLSMFIAVSILADY